jgi:hypothetical protein
MPDVSPYVRYWVKANLIWSIIVTVLLVGLAALWVFAGMWTPFGLVVIVHILMCVMGAFAASFNYPFGYLFVSRHFCEDEMAAVYG